MSADIRAVVSMEETIDKSELCIRHIISIEIAPAAPKRSYIIKADFGKFDIKTSVGRFTKHTIEKLKGKQIL